MSYVLEARGLTKSFFGTKVVNRLSLRIPEGHIYGFLGPNGAGKTTMRMLVGLTMPDDGDVFYRGKDIREWKQSMFEEVGCFIDSPQYYPNLTGYENVASIQRVLRKPLSEVDRVLQLTGIEHAKDKKVKNYSLGMKQRLALALALLNDPKTLILDEPTNGLDPEGIHEIRHMLIDLAKKEGKTVFISSHNLAEIEMMADTVSLIHHGETLYEGDLDQLRRADQYDVVTGQSDKTVAILEEMNIAYESLRQGHFKIDVNEEDVPSFVESLVQAGVKLYEIRSQRKTLEDVFLDLTRTEGKAGR